MLIDGLRATSRHRLPGWFRIGGAVLLAGIAAGAVLLVTHWPFTRESIVRALETSSGQQVQIHTFSRTFLRPGFTAEGIRFFRKYDGDAKPLMTIRKLVVRATLLGLLGSPTRLSSADIVGMHIIVPPKSGSHEKTIVPLNSGLGGSSIAISEIDANGAVLEFLAKGGGRPYVLKVARLRLSGVGAKTRMGFQATLINSEPPGTILCTGKFGPWNPENIGATGVSGSYTYDNIDLAFFEGITGRARANGEFTGALSRIHTHGTVEVPDFQVRGTGHPAHLTTKFQATVNGTNGDVRLDPAIARYRDTDVEVRGWIAARPGQKEKTAAFDASVPKGRIDDLLYLFTSGPPGMKGPVAIRGNIVWPPGPQRFLKLIRMNLEFGMGASRFTSRNTQDSINRLSESAQGEKRKQMEEDGRTVLSAIDGEVSVHDGIAVVSHGRLEAPGAAANVRGTYDLVSERIDLHGTLYTAGRLSDTASGLKALLLKAVTPLLLRKKQSMRVVPFRISGKYGHTSVGIDWKHHPAR